MTWTPSITVAAVTERGGKFLLIEELVAGRRVYNQPAGHLEENESLTEAVVRETLEEAALRFVPEHLLGVYHWQQPNGGDAYIRIAFAGRIEGGVQPVPRDEGILGTAWLSPEEVLALPAERLRGPLVLRCIEDHLAGVRHPLSALSCINDCA